MKRTDYRTIIEAAQKLTGTKAQTKKGAWKALRPWLQKQRGVGLTQKPYYMNPIPASMLYWCEPGNGLGPDDPRLISYREAWKKTSWRQRAERGAKTLLRAMGLQSRWESIQAGGCDDWERALVAEARKMKRDSYSALIYADSLPAYGYSAADQIKLAWYLNKKWPLDNARQCAQDVEKFGGDEHGGWQTRCNFDNKGRGEAINVDIYGVDGTQKLYVIQVRQFIRAHKGWYPQLKKSYFLIGYNENGKVKKQPPDLTAGEFNRREC